MQRRSLSLIFAALLVASAILPLVDAGALSAITFDTKTTVDSTSAAQFQRVYENGTSSIIFLDGNSNGTLARSEYDIAGETVSFASSPLFVGNATGDSSATTPTATAASSTDTIGIMWYSETSTTGDAEMIMDQDGSNGVNQGVAQKVSSVSSPLYDRPVNVASLFLEKNQDPTETVVIGVYNAPSGGTSQVELYTFGSIAGGALTISRAQYWFNGTAGTYFLLSSTDHAVGIDAGAVDGAGADSVSAWYYPATVEANTFLAQFAAVAHTWSDSAAADLAGVFGFIPHLTFLDDGVPQSFWRNNVDSEAGANVTADQGSTKPVRGVKAYFNDAAEIPATIDVYVSDDTGDWGAVVDTWTTDNVAGWQSFNFSAPVEGRHVKLEVDTWGADVRWRMGELQTLVAPEINSLPVASPVDLSRYSLLYDGSTQYAQAATNAVYDVTTEDFWMAGMFKRTSTPGDNQFLEGKRTGSVTTNSYYLAWLSTSSQLSSLINDSSGEDILVLTDHTIQNNEWYVWGISFDRDGNRTMYLYRISTGDLFSISDNISAKSASLTNTGTFTVGRRPNAASGFFPGHMDNLIPPQIGQTLTQAQFLEFATTGAIDGVSFVSWYDFNDGMGTTASDQGGSNTLTLFNAPTWSSDVTAASTSRPSAFIAGRDSVNAKVGIAKVDLAGMQQVGTNTFPSTSMTTVKDIAQTTTKIYVIGRDASANLRLGILDRDMTGYSESTIVTGGVLDNVARLAVYEGSPDTVYAFYHVAGSVLKVVKYTAGASVNPAAMTHTAGDFSIIQMSGKVAVQASGKLYELNTSTDAVTEVQDSAFNTRYLQPFTISPGARAFKSNAAFVSNATFAENYAPTTGASARTGALIDTVNTGGSGTIETYNPAKYYFATANDLMIEATSAGATEWTIKDPGTRQQIVVSPYSEDVGIALVQNDTIFENDVIKLVCDNGDYLIEIKYFAIGDDADCDTWKTLDQSGETIGRDLPFARTKDLVHADLFTSYNIHMVAASDPSQFSATMQYGGKDVDYSIFDGADNANVNLLYGQCYTVVYKRINTGEVEQTDTICADDIANKEAILTAGFSFNFWASPWGVTHNYNTTSNMLGTVVRHEPAPYNYTVNVSGSNGTLLVNNTYVAASIYDTQSIDLSAHESAEPLKLEVFAEDGRNIYLVYLDDQPLYLKPIADLFQDWGFAGWNILMFLPIIFIAMFTKNTIGIGGGMTGAFVAFLDWFGILDLPDPVVWIIVVVGVIVFFAARKKDDF